MSVCMHCHEEIRTNLHSVTGYEHLNSRLIGCADSEHSAEAAPSQPEGQQPNMYTCVLHDNCTIVNGTHQPTASAGTAQDDQMGREPDLVARLWALPDGAGWHFTVDPISEQNRGGVGSDPTLQGAGEKLGAMLPHVWDWKDAGVESPQGSGNVLYPAGKYAPPAECSGIASCTQKEACLKANRCLKNLPDTEPGQR